MQQPPPPRYVLQVSTGKWRSQPLSPDTGPIKGAEHLQNSMDYFLKRAMYASVRAANDGNCAQCLTAEAPKELEWFETRHCPKSSRGPSSAPLNVNPIIGLLSGVPLYDICDALVKQKGVIWKRQEDGRLHGAALELSFDELYDVCRQLVPNMVSREYLHRMFYLLLASEEKDVLHLSCFFSFLVEHAFHPALNRNVDALFKAFDPDGTGVISATTLKSKVIFAWAELNLFGSLRVEWEKMGTALELTNGVDLRIADGARLLTPKAARAVFCASRTLYTVMESIDMDEPHLNKSSS
ncbi:hypothetical protein TraAM80_06813 [Trypanosoma rangeli]|uniref:EF-hand domain-containing protein n=1 Tax=Trypanosoma rangeli TaxID=5698 RepID=A0A422N8A3_TRYRA|nr:uncharacterized protein TraAM80_06813 [Trypanosoma rangeli]RNF01690.1 hypothetical protein TraAM80_06813 [Trypanosoma rangeli]|eukprot:RNF01690.1 hypothetical protein TraAM80_06813 [Trypanosoma rangeli]